MKCFRHVILKTVIDNYIEYYNSSYIETKIEGLSANALERRKAVNFLADALFMSVEKSRIVSFTEEDKGDSHEERDRYFKKMGFPTRSGYEFGILFHAPSTRVALAFGGFKVIADVLGQKGDPLVKEVGDAAERKTDKIVSSRQALYDKDCLLTENDECALNRPKVFDATTTILESLLKYVYNIKRCNREREAIKKEINSASSTALLTDGL
ncbi:MAG TPA: hypothetical protein VD978_37025 [Azospirillum sp.]|nr:hypothetical protein [Azospirillum sp.]